MGVSRDEAEDRDRGDGQSSTSPDVTHILKEWQQGDQTALARLVPFVYEELRRLARNSMSKERSTHTLQATALVHEAFLRLVGRRVEWNDRIHFYATAARIMRRVLVDHARSHRAGRRGGGAQSVPLSVDVAREERAPDVVELDEALDALAEIDEQKSQIIELRYFGGLTIEETAELLQTKPSSIWQESELAKAWLFAEIEKGRDCAS